MAPLYNDSKTYLDEAPYNIISNSKRLSKVSYLTKHVARSSQCFHVTKVMIVIRTIVTEWLIFSTNFYPAKF